MNTNLRHISYCLIALLLFVACRKESHPNTPEEPEEQYAISLSASSTDMTTSRAIVDSEATLQATTLGVFAYKQLPNGDKVTVFNNTEVTYDTDEGWTYTGTKYWDRTARYYFVSYSPHQDTDITYDMDASKMAINNIPNWQVIDANAIDYVMANSQGAADGKYITSNGAQPVELNFEHILSQLEVRVAKSPLLVNSYTLNTISYENVPTREGKASYNYTIYSPNRPTEGGWGDIVADIANAPIDMATLSDVTIPSSSDLDTEKGTTLAHLVAPFHAFNAKGENFKIHLNYKVNGEARPTKEVDTGLNQLEKNKRYVLTLTFNSGADISTTLKILDWEDEEVEEDKYNW